MKQLISIFFLSVFVIACGPNNKKEELPKFENNSGQTLLELATQQYEALNYDSSIFFINQIKSGDSQNFDAILLEGDVRWAQRDYENSMAAYTTCLKINESKPIIWARLGKVYLEQKDFEAALKYFNQSINLSPTFADAYIGRAAVFAEKGEMDQAKLSLQTALDFDPDNYKGWLRMAKWQLADTNEIAIQCYTNALRIDSSSAAVFVERGMANFEFGYTEMAKRDFNKAIALNPEYLQAYFNLAYLHFENEEFELARDYFLKCSALKTDDTDALLGVALCEAQLGNIKEAQLALQKILEIDPNDPDAARELEKLQ